MQPLDDSYHALASKCHFWKLCMFWFALVNTTKHKKMCSVHNKNIVASQFWQLEVHDQDFKRFSSQWSFSSWLIDEIFLLCAHMTSCLFMRRDTILVSLLLRTLVLQDYDPVPHLSFKFPYRLSIKTCHIVEGLGLQCFTVDNPNFQLDH